MKHVLSLYIILCSFSLHAKVIELKKNLSTIYIEEKKDWKLGKELFGMPFIYFSPQQNGQRSNISFTDTGAELELDIKALATTQKNYQDARKRWADSIGANIISFGPYEVKINKNGHKLHNVSFQYTHENKIYAETSYYIECKGKLLFSKSLRLKENINHEKDFHHLVDSLDCGGI